MAAVSKHSNKEIELIIIIIIIIIEHWVDPVPEPLLLRKSVSAGNRARTSGSVARSSEYKTTEAVLCV
jgi:hypothetical protein